MAAVPFQVADGGLNGTGDLQLNVTLNSIGVTILPITFAGTINADLGTGEISIGAASPSDSYTVSVTITDNCGATAEQDFALEVVVDSVFADGFEQD